MSVSEPAIKVIIDIQPDGAATWRCAAANGTSHQLAEVVRVLGLMVADYAGKSALKVPTLREIQIAERIAAEEAAEACALPDGWEVTLDGHSVTVQDGVGTFTRTFRRTEWVEVQPSLVAPCGPKGEPVPETRSALLAWDAANDTVLRLVPPVEPAR